MYVFGNDTGARGCFKSFNIHNAIKRGAYLQMPTGYELPRTSTDPFVVTGLTFGQKEKYHLVQCFNDTVHTYAFGHDPTSSIVTVDFTGFMISTDGTTWSDLFSSMLMEYQSNRLSQLPEYATVYIGQYPLRGFLVSMSSSTASDQHNLQHFRMDLLAVEVHGS